MARQWAGNVPEIKGSICKYISGPEMAQKWPGNGPEMAQKKATKPPSLYYDQKLAYIFMTDTNSILAKISSVSQFSVRTGVGPRAARARVGM